MACSGCGHRTLLSDGITSCDSCGLVQEYLSYEQRTYCPQGPVGQNARFGTSGTGSSLAYKEKKIYEANKIIDEITFRLDLEGRTVDEIRSMIDEITEGEYGQGEWFKVLIGACSYAYMRSQNKALSMGEGGQAVECDVYELGNMVSRVVEHLDLRLPQFDIVSNYERLVSKFRKSGRIVGDMVGRVRSQGVFFIQCAEKWCLTTGRRPLPIVAAVFALVAELNGIHDIGIEDVAQTLLVSVVTSRTRYKELLEKLVEVAQALPWGKNVTVKNVVKNAPLIIQYMELKSSTKRHKGSSENFDSAAFDIGEIVIECLRNRFSYGVDDDGGGGDEEHRKGIAADDFANIQLSHECLSMAYEKFLEEGGGSQMYSEESGGGVPSQREEYRGMENHLYASSEWWTGKSPLSKKLPLKDILEKDVGLEAMPPSFVQGCAATERRRAKIEAAKERIKRIGLPPLNGDRCIDLVDAVYSKKRKRKGKEDSTDWEDEIIEALVVHKVIEEEIEKGYYKALLGLHVFNSLSKREGNDLNAECRSDL
ncbi:Plant-specific TFIIB-related protein PTF2 [Linum perenne]